MKCLMMATAFCAKASVKQIRTVVRVSWVFALQNRADVSLAIPGHIPTANTLLACAARMRIVFAMANVKRASASVPMGSTITLCATMSPHLEDAPSIGIVEHLLNVERTISVAVGLDSLASILVALRSNLSATFPTI